MSSFTDAPASLGLRRSVLLAAIAAVAVGVALCAWQPWYGVALIAGGIAGAANAQLSMRANEWLMQRGRVPSFVLSSFGRLCVFGIVPVVVALRAPSLWTLVCYFMGFFAPLAAAAAGVFRNLRREAD